MTMQRPAPPAAPSSARRVLAVVLVGTLALTLNNSVMSVALPKVADDFEGGPEVDWLITAFLLGVVTILPATGWVAERFGRRRVFIASMLLFGLGAAVCAAAPIIHIDRRPSGAGPSRRDRARATIRDACCGAARSDPPLAAELRRIVH